MGGRRFVAATAPPFRSPLAAGTRELLGTVDPMRLAGLEIPDADVRDLPSFSLGRLTTRQREGRVSASPGGGWHAQTKFSATSGRYPAPLRAEGCRSDRLNPVDVSGEEGDPPSGLAVADEMALLAYEDQRGVHALIQCGARSASKLATPATSTSDGLASEMYRSRYRSAARSKRRSPLSAYRYTSARA